MSERLIFFGDLADRYEMERLLSERHAGLHVETVGRSWDLVERACTGGFDVAVVLKGPIWEHQQRLEVVAALRRNSFAGRIIYGGSFLAEKQDALAAGADYVFDPNKQPTEEVAWRALEKPRLAADHLYLRRLFVGEWAAIEAYLAELPAQPPDVLLAATSLHGDEAFYGTLARYSLAHLETRCVLVEDEVAEEVQVAALASGIQPYIVLADEGLRKVHEVAHGFLRERWLARVAGA
ncbi:MAG: hypothetical protein V1750_02370 [Acidobacteriota bacterium]